MIRKYGLIPLGDKRLRTKSKLVKFPLKSEIKEVIKEMKRILNSTILVGLAAPQVGVNYRIFISRIKSTPARDIGKEDKLRVYINPKIVHKSKERVTIWEGCGSVAKTQIFAPVTRPKVVTVEAFDVKGKKFTLKADGLLGRVILHEVDHLDGKLFIDYVSPKRYVDKEYYIKHIRNNPEVHELIKVRILEVKES